jgi:hypothetical protein
MLAGLLAFPVTRAWWRRIWPDEEATEYAGRAGYLAAAAIRWTLFAILFLPLAGLAALLWALLAGVLRLTRARPPGKARG